MYDGNLPPKESRPDDRRRRHQAASDLPCRPLGRIAGHPRRSPTRPTPPTPAGATYNATEAQYEEAVEAAVAAFEVTRKLPAYERGRILRDISAGIKARREELGRLIALEAGKPIRDALVEVDRAVLTFRLGAEEAERMTGELIPLDLMPSSKDRVGITRRFPIGPIAAISPFNFPLNLAAHKLAPAIASGNPIVLKPPSKDPLTMLDRGRDHRGGRCRRRARSASCR